MDMRALIFLMAQMGSERAFSALIPEYLLSTRLLRKTKRSGCNIAAFLSGSSESNEHKHIQSIPLLFVMLARLSVCPASIEAQQIVRIAEMQAVMFPRRYSP